MNKKIVAIVFTIMGILLIISGLSLIVYKQLNGNNNKDKESNILKEYEIFKNKVENFNTIRDSYYNVVAKNLYPESVETDYDDWVEYLDKYTKATDEVNNVSTNLKNNCVNFYYSNKDVNNKCQSFIIAYETTINYYTKDVLAFNENLNLYRRNSYNNNKDVKDYDLKYDYVDIDSNGKFYGRD